MKKLSRNEMKNVNGGVRDGNTCPSVPQCFSDIHCYNYPYPIGSTPTCIPCLNNLGSYSNRCGYTIEPTDPTEPID